MIESAGEKSKDETVNVGAQQVAAKYAQALLGAAEKQGQSEAVVEEFDALVHMVLDRFGKLETVLASALVPPEEKTALLDRVFGGRLSGLLLDFLKVVAHHDRLDILRSIHQEVHRLLDDMRGRVRVQLSTATPLADGLADRLVGSLRTLLGGEPRMESLVDPALIGGIVLRVGDTVYDGSLARQLTHLREQMIHRSVHEIQSRRDRFRHSGGN
jgi:F-type H+-transporting ATPase subunit delta